MDRMPKALGEPWPPTLFTDVHKELDQRIRLEHMPRFMDHPIFEEILKILGAYNADYVFSNDDLERVKKELVAAVDGDLSATAASEYRELLDA